MPRDTGTQVHLNSFEKGLNTDQHESYIPVGHYVSAKNAVHISTDNGDIFSFANEKGFVSKSNFHEIRPDAFVIGMYPLNGSIIILSIRRDFNGYTTDSEVGVIENINTSANYRTVINDANPDYWVGGNIYQDQRWDFDINYQADITGRIGFKGERLIYWTDGKNHPRFLNIDIDYTHPLNKFNHIAKQTQLFDNYKRPIIKFLGFEKGGNIKCGVVQFAARYLNSSLDKTGFGYVCHPIPIVDDSREGGRDKYDGENFDAPSVAKSVKLRVNNIDTDYKYIEFAVIFYEGSGASFKAFTFRRTVVTGETMDITYDGRNDDELLLEDFNDTKVIYSNAKHAIQKDGRLFLSNLNSLPIQSLQGIANKLRIRYTIEDIEWKHDDQSYFGDYKDEANTFYKKGYLRGEVYSFGIGAILKDGTETFIAHIPGYHNISTSASGGYLGTYVSERKYIERDIYTDVNGVELYGTGIRHHRFPTLEQEPHFIYYQHSYSDAYGWVEDPQDPRIGKFYIRVMGIQVEGLSEALNSFPVLKNQIRSLHVVRQQRNNFANKSIYSQGLLNQLHKQDGKYKNEFRRKVKQNLYFTGIDDMQPTYIQNPFAGNSYMMDYNAGVFMNGRFMFHGPDYIQPDIDTGNGIVNKIKVGEVYEDHVQQHDAANNGDEGRPNHDYTLPTFYVRNDNTAFGLAGREVSGLSGEKNARQCCFWHSPEQVFLTEPNIPVGAEIRPVMLLRGFPQKVYKPDSFLKVGKGTVGENSNDDLPWSRKLVLDADDLTYGNYQDSSRYPFVKKFRAPWFHVFTNYIYPVIQGISSDRAQKGIINAVKTVEWNPKLENNSDVENLKTWVKETSSRLNNYDGESGWILECENDIPVYHRWYDLFDNESTKVVLGCTFHALGDDEDIWDWDSAHQLNNYDPNFITELLAELGDLIQTIFPIHLGPLEEKGYISGMNQVGLPSVQNRLMYNIVVDNKSQYGDLDGSQYIMVDPLLSDEYDAPVTRTLYGGDVFITKFAYRNSNRIYYFVAQPKKGSSANQGISILSEEHDAKNNVYGGWTRIEQNEGAELRQLNYYFVESEINCSYRHRETKRDVDGNFEGFGPPYYPQAKHYEALDSEGEFDESQGYNIQYSKQNTVTKYVTRPFGYQDNTHHPTRTIYSEQSIEGEQSDMYRQFLANNYQDLPKNKGEITNQFVLDNNLYLHTERSLFKTFVNQNQMVQSTEEEIYLGNASVFSITPQEIFSLEGGYTGTLHKWAGVPTPFGYVFPDYHQKKVFLFNEGLNEISQTGQYAWFVQNLYVDNSLQSVINNPCNPEGAGCIAFYDPEYKRYVLTIIQNLTGFNKYKTISYSFLTNSWVSYHDYRPAICTSIDNDVYSFPNEFSANNEHTLRHHNSGHYGVYYDGVIKPFSIRFVVNKDVQTSKVFDAMEVYGEIIDIFGTKARQHTDFFDTMQFWTDYQNTGVVDCVVQDNRIEVSPNYENTMPELYRINVRVFNNQYQIKVPLSATRNSYLSHFTGSNTDQAMWNKARMRSKYLTCEFIYRNTDNFYFVLNHILTKLRTSFR